MRLFTRISDRPGGLAALLTLIAEAGGNVVHADHVRDAVSLHVRETGIEVTLETRSAQHGDAIVAVHTEQGEDDQSDQTERRGNYAGHAREHRYWLPL